MKSPLLTCFPFLLGSFKWWNVEVVITVFYMNSVYLSVSPLLVYTYFLRTHFNLLNVIFVLTLHPECSRHLNETCYTVRHMTQPKGSRVMPLFWNSSFFNFCVSNPCNNFQIIFMDLSYFLWQRGGLGVYWSQLVIVVVSKWQIRVVHLLYRWCARRVYQQGC